MADTCRRIYHLIATLADPAMEGGQRWPSSSSGSRLRANSLLKSVLIWRPNERLGFDALWQLPLFNASYLHEQRMC